MLTLRHVLSAKYGLAVTAHLLRVLNRIAMGYDIGCKFEELCRSHPILGQLADDKEFIALVGAFHGHGHNRKCQTKKLTTYVKGVGLEPLETCESYFSKSNALAATTRHASRFHRQRAIVNYMAFTDRFETYQGLCACLWLSSVFT